METITIKDIAKLCGVGVSTVSRAMNNHPDINEETKQKIMEVIKDYHYVPNNSARNLKRADAKAIAVLIKGITNPFFSKMIKVFEQEIQEKKYTFVLQHVDDHQDEVDVAIRLEKEKRLNGIVFLGGHFSHSQEKLEQIPVPFVLSTIGLRDQSGSEKYSSVYVDDVEESAKMVRYLIGQGHRKIAIIASGEDDESIGRLRLEGYKRALEENGIAYDESYVARMKDYVDSYSMENGYAVTRELLESGKDFTAVFAISDSIAIGCCKAIFDAGKSVPEHYSVAGFDGLEMAAYYHPSITTIRQPVEEMAEDTIKMLFDVILNGAKERQRVFEGELIEGKSVKKI